MQEQKSEVRDKIIQTRELSDQTEQMLRAALEEFKTQFAAKRGAAK